VLGSAGIHSSGVADVQALTKTKGEKKMKVWKIFTLTAVVLMLAEVVLARFMTWLPGAIPIGLLALLPPVALALALVAYFDWRGRLKSRIVDEDGGDEEPACAA